MVPTEKIGVLECWRIGVLDFKYITPPLQCSFQRPDRDELGHDKQVLALAALVKM
jgi:hypothetical protein